MRTPPFRLIALLSAPVLAGNLLANGDFEAGLDGWRVWGATTSANTHAGKGSSEARAAENAWVGLDQVVVLPATAKTLTLSGWIQADGVRQGPEDWNKGRLGLDFLDARDSVVGGWQLVAGQARGRTPWTRVERTYAVPEGATKAKVICALANAHGTFRCDDLEAIALP